MMASIFFMGFPVSRVMLPRSGLAGKLAESLVTKHLWADSAGQSLFHPIRRAHAPIVSCERLLGFVVPSSSPAPPDSKLALAQLETLTKLRPLLLAE
jgi:hypothetical protein